MTDQIAYDPARLIEFKPGSFKRGGDLARDELKERELDREVDDAS